MPRHLEIIYEINRRFSTTSAAGYPGDDARRQRMSVIEETPTRKVRMAHLAVVGTHSTNGVAEIHSGLLRTSVLADFAEMFPARFNNKTNGVTPRRWLLMANPALARLITERDRRRMDHAIWRSCAGLRPWRVTPRSASGSPMRSVRQRGGSSTGFSGRAVRPPIQTRSSTAR